MRLDIDAVRDAAGPTIYQAAEELLASGRLSEIARIDGGAGGTVDNGDDPPHDVWVGIVSGGLTWECDCVEADELCVHAVAITLAAVREEFAWSPASSPPIDTDPNVRRLADLAATLPPDRLAELVGEHAATDPVLQARLLAAASEPGSRAEPAAAVT